MDIIPYSQFEQVELRVGRVIAVADFPEARKPAYILTIDFGADIGTRKSSAQITEKYAKEELMNRLVVCVVNFAAKQIGPLLSKCLVCGTNDAEGRVTLLHVDAGVPLGSKIY
ncbi:MAG: tRNA-binding protein [Candidatus Peribacteria bacterium]|nr:tRNA-binding protein [Candidatus Peribacteria bacterium]